MTKEAAINLSYLAAAELLKEAAEEEGIDLDQMVDDGELDEDTHAEMLDETVLDLAEAGELDDIFAEVPDEEFDDLDVEADGFIGKTAELLKLAGGKNAPPWGTTMADRKKYRTDLSNRAKRAKKELRDFLTSEEGKKYKKSVKDIQKERDAFRRFLAKERYGKTAAKWGRKWMRHKGKIGAAAGIGALGLGGLGYMLGRRD